MADITRVNRSHRLRRCVNQTSATALAIEDLESENEDLVLQNQQLKNTLRQLLYKSDQFNELLSGQVKEANLLLEQSIERDTEKDTTTGIQKVQSQSSVPVLRKSMSVSDKGALNVPKKERKPRSTSGEFPATLSLKQKSTNSVSNSQPNIQNQIESTNSNDFDVKKAEDSDEFSQFIVSKPKKGISVTNMQKAEPVNTKNKKTRRSYSSGTIINIHGREEQQLQQQTQQQQQQSVEENSGRKRRSKSKILKHPQKNTSSVKSPERGWTSKMHGNDAVVITFDSDSEQDYYSLVNIIDLYRNSSSENNLLECYEGDCIITKHGEGSFYSTELSEPLCGIWINDELIESHHDFLSPNDLDYHMNTFHMATNTNKNVNKQIENTSVIDLKLPEEIFNIIFSFLDLQSLIFVSLVSKKWNRLVNGSAIWQSLHLNVWGKYETDKFLLQNNECIYDLDWKEIVRNRYVLDKNWRTGNCHATVLQGHNGWVTCVDVHHNRLVSSSYDGTVRVWNTQTGHSIQTFGTTGSSPAWCVQFRTNNIFAGYSDSIIRQWNTNTGQQVHQFQGHAGGVKSIQVSL